MVALSLRIIWCSSASSEAAKGEKEFLDRIIKDYFKMDCTSSRTSKETYLFLSSSMVCISIVKRTKTVHQLSGTVCSECSVPEAAQHIWIAIRRTVTLLEDCTVDHTILEDHRVDHIILYDHTSDRRN